MDAEFPCRVCGLEQGWDRWRPRSHTICFCCLTEMGREDDTLGAVLIRRMIWLTNGAKFAAMMEDAPDHWIAPDKWTLEDVTEQLKNVPEKWWYPIDN